MSASPDSSPSPRALADLLAEVTTAGGDVDPLLLSWSPRTLIEVDAATRSWRFDFEPAQRRFAWSHRHRSRPSEVALLSMTHDGHRREAAVRMLASRPGAASDRLLAVRLGDHVPQVRRAAWQALLARPLAPQVAVVVPVLVALRGRVVAATALDDYAQAAMERLGHPLWRNFLDHPDRETRRWAVTKRIEHGLEPATALLLLDGEQDLVVVRALLKVAVGDQEVTRRLLSGHTAIARRHALEVLPATTLSSEQIESALVDRSVLVRQMAAFRAPDVGIDPRNWYRRRWEEQRDPRALAGFLDAGGTLSRTEAHTLLEALSSRLHRLGVRFLARLGLQRDDLPLLWRLLDGPAAAQTVRALARSYCWGWSDVADSWDEADERLRRRLWRLLSSRGGWDEVRAHLLAATDPRIAALGRAGLDSWALHRASRVYRAPIPEQLDHILALLASAEIPGWQRERISFLTGL